MPDADIRVTDVSKRGMAPPKLNTLAVTYIIDGEPGEHTMWLGDFLAEYAPRVKVEDPTALNGSDDARE